MTPTAALRAWRKTIPIAFRFIGVGFQATLSLLVTAWCTRDVSDQFFSCWAAVQIWSVVGQFGNGWRACIELTQRRGAATAIGQMIRTAGFSRLPVAIGGVGLAVALPAMGLIDSPAVVAAWVLVYIAQTALLMIADLMRGLDDHTAANLTSTGLATGLSTVAILMTAAMSISVDSIAVLTACMAVTYGLSLLISAYWFHRIWQRRPITDSTQMVATRTDGDVEMSWRESTRFFFLRLSQVGLSQGPVIVLAAMGPPAAATCFALGQRLTVCSSIFATYLNSTAPSYLAGYLGGEKLAIQNLRSLVWLCFFLSVLGGVAGLGICMYVDAAFDFGGVVVMVYMIMTLGQWFTTATAAGPAGQTLIAATPRPLEIAAWLPGVLVFLTYIVLFDIESATTAAWVLTCVYLLNGILGNLWLSRLRGRRLDIFGLT